MRSSLTIGAWLAYGMLTAHPFAAAQGVSMPLPKPSAATPFRALDSTTPASSADSVSAAASTPAQRSVRRAEISFARGQLSVKAENSSLNQILREIGRQTGIKITGGVAEERVFGSYGPASPADVLAKLLDGTSSNLLLLATEDGSPGELVLTPRLGGVTPPNPNAPGFDDDSEDGGSTTTRSQPAQPSRGVTLFGPLPENQNQTPPPTGTTQLPTPPAAQVGTDPSTASPQGAQQSPNAVKTPLEIFQQLQQLRQQQTQQNTPPQ